MREFLQGNPAVEHPVVPDELYLIAAATGNIFFFIFRLRFVIYIYGAKIKNKERNTKFFEYTL